VGHLSPLMEKEKYIKQMLFKKPERRDGCEHSTELLVCLKACMPTERDSAE
jgi:hypothetical protein